MSGKWRGTALFAGIAAALAGVFGLRVLTLPAASAGTAESPITDVGGGSDASSGGGSVIGSTPAPSDSPSTSAGGGSGAASGSAKKVVDGDVERTQFGPYQVEVTFSGAKIAKVTELQTPSDGRSLAINQYAAPTLQQEVIASQSARIDSVSGATITSEAYAASVQSAIDRRG